MTTEEFIKRAKEIHGDKYDYSLVDYKNCRTKVKIICPKHGVFEQKSSKHLRGQGCPNCNKSKNLTTEEFIKRAKEIHGDKYDYSLVDYKNNYTKVKIKCNTCCDICEQRPDIHLSGAKCKCSCFEKEIIKKNSLSTEEFIKRAKDIYGDKYDYSLVDYKNNHTKVKIICSKHGVFEQVPASHLNYRGCQRCHQSSGETKIDIWLNKNGFENKFEFQKHFKDCRDINTLPFDFYIPSKNLLIEYNGKQHYFKRNDEDLKSFHKRRHHDWIKRKYAKKHNIKLLTIPYWNDKILEEILKENLLS